MQLTIMDSAKIDMVSDSTGNATTGGTFYHAMCGLYQTNLTITPSMVKADIDSSSATFAGYGADTITWGAPTRSDDGFIESIGTMPAFRPTDSVTPNNIWGLYVWDRADNLIFAGPFDNAPLPMASPLDQITQTLRYRPDATIPVVVIS